MPRTTHLKKSQRLVKTHYKTVRRNYWVRTDSANPPHTQSFVRRHAGKAVGAAAALTAATVLAKHRHGLALGVQGAMSAYRGVRVASYAKHLFTGNGISAANHLRATAAGARAGYAAGSIADSGRARVHRALGIPGTLVNMGYGLAVLGVAGVRAYKTANRIIQHADRVQRVHRSLTGKSARLGR